MMVGVAYSSIPRVVMDILRAAAANHSRGTMVTSPAKKSSKLILAPAWMNEPELLTKSDKIRTVAKGLINKVSKK